jgi:hypothetical protein
MDLLDNDFRDLRCRVPSTSAVRENSCAKNCANELVRAGKSSLLAGLLATVKSHHAVGMFTVTLLGLLPATMVIAN